MVLRSSGCRTVSAGVRKRAQWLQLRNKPLGLGVCAARLFYRGQNASELACGRFSRGESARGCIACLRHIHHPRAASPDGADRCRVRRTDGNLDGRHPKGLVRANAPDGHRRVSRSRPGLQRILLGVSRRGRHREVLDAFGNYVPKIDFAIAQHPGGQPG